MIRLDTAGQQLDLLVPEAELAARQAAWTAPPPYHERGYGALYAEHVTQADEGCDFLARAGRVPEPETY